jgi:Putative auto-transporter adhesin, head GIN domain
MKQYVMAVAAVCLFFISCKKEGKEQTTREFSASNFTKLNMGCNLEVNVIKSISFSVKAEGRLRDVDDMKAEVQNGELKIWFTDVMQKRERVKVTISMPSLTRFDFNGNSRVTVSNFTETTDMAGMITGNTKATVNANAPKFKLEVSGNSELTVNGSAENVYANVSGNSLLNAYGVPAKGGEVIATGNSKIKIYTSVYLNASANGNSYIFFKGNPGGRFFGEFDNSKIIEE